MHIKIILTKHCANNLWKIIIKRIGGSIYEKKISSIRKCTHTHTSIWIYLKRAKNKTERMYTSKHFISFFKKERVQSYPATSIPTQCCKIVIWKWYWTTTESVIFFHQMVLLQKSINTLTVLYRKTDDLYMFLVRKTKTADSERNRT